MVALAFLLGALVASALHARLFTSAYPLWLLFGLNGGLAAVAGTAVFFVREEPEPENPDLLLVPRAAWEQLLRERGPVSQGVRPRWDESEEDRSAPPARTPFEPPLPYLEETAALGRDRRSVAAPALRRPPDALRQELGLLELQGFAQTAIATGENVGPAELERLLDRNAQAIARLGATLGRPPRENESTGLHLLRLLREVAALPPPEVGAKRALELAALADRLDQLLVSAPVAPRHEEIGSPLAEFNQLLEELERRQGGAAPGPAAEPPHDEPPEP